VVVSITVVAPGFLAEQTTYHIAARLLRVIIHNDVDFVPKYVSSKTIRPGIGTIALSLVADVLASALLIISS
jgi:hypothetical protein